MIHPKIIHHGFLQPHELTPHLIDAAAFVMPSKKEPWGVVLHEMAIAGLPMLASRAVGASTEFIDSTKNGTFLTKETIAQDIKGIMERPAQQIDDFSAKSHQLGTGHSPIVWCNALKQLVSS